MAERGYEPLTKEIRESLHKGRAEGRAEGLRRAIVAACGAFDAALTAERERAMSVLDEAGLASLLDAILRNRGWPTH